MSDDNPSRRGATMIDRELPTRAHKGTRGPEIAAADGLRGRPPAAGGLHHPADRRMIGVRRPANGEFPLMSRGRALSLPFSNWQMGLL
jgi:hypothetical protein